MIRIGQKLAEERIKQGLTIEDAAKATKIKASFLSAIEKGDFTKLPSSTYSKGFLVNYAQFLGLPKKEALALFKREFDEEKAYQVLPKGFIEKKTISGKKFRQIFSSVFIVLLVFTFYILFQYRYAIFPPPLDINSPKENQVLGSKVTVEGKTDSNATLYVNSDVILLEKDGSFKEEINLFPGKKVLKIKAVNRFGKETLVERKIKISP